MLMNLIAMLEGGNTTVGGEDVGDAGLATVMEKLNDIVNGTIMPIIWIVLGLFLVVKGAILGMQIVKAADEPQVRQEKIGSLKWLVIGVAIAYGVSGVASFVLNYFKNAVGTGSTTGTGN